MRTTTLFIVFTVCFATALANTPAEESDDSKPPSLEYSGDSVTKNAKYEKENKVVVLTEENFDNFLTENPTTLIEFYAPWCGHCKKLAPEYSIAAKSLEKSVPLAKIDCTMHAKLCSRFSVQGYPTLKLFKKGLSDPIDFDGGRDSTAIVEWVNAKTDPNYKPPKEEVIALTIETFDDFVAKAPIVLIEFYAPWCGHCKKLAPEYERAAKILKQHNIPLAKVDATVEKKLADQYGIEGYPSLKIFRNGRRFDYDGPREATGIVQYMLEQIKPAAQEIHSVKEAQKLLVFNDVTIFGFFKTPEGKLFDAFIEAAEKTRKDFVVLYTSNIDVIKHFKASTETIFIFYPQIFWSKYEPKSVIFKKKIATSDELLTFWRENSTPLVGQKTRVNAATRYAKLPLIVVYYNVDFTVQYREGTQFWRNKVLKIANKYKNYKFAVADEEEFAQELNDLGLGDSGLEQNVVAFGVDGKKYPMNGKDYDNDLEENLSMFIANISKGKVKPFIKSAPLLKTDKGPVKTVVGSNFDKIVNNEAKDVLIEFYAPWCGHCKSFEPKYKQFATKHSTEELNFVVAKFDATSNDAPSNYVVDGFPTIYFAPSGKKSTPIKYTGNRDLEDLESFVKKHAVLSFQKRDEL